MTQVSAIHTDCLTVAQTADILPDHLFVTERGPAVRFTFRNELFKSSAFGSNEKRFSCDTVEVGYFTLALDGVYPILSEGVA